MQWPGVLKELNIFGKSQSSLASQAELVELQVLNLVLHSITYHITL